MNHMCQNVCISVYFNKASKWIPVPESGNVKFWCL